MQGFYNILHRIGRHYSSSCSGFAQTAIKITGTPISFTGMDGAPGGTSTGFIRTSKTSASTDGAPAGTSTTFIGTSKSFSHTDRTPARTSTTFIGAAITFTGAGNFCRNTPTTLFLTKNQ